MSEISVGSIIANGADPNTYGFICGSIIEMCDAFCTILLPGGTRGFIYPKEITHLQDVVERHPEAIVAQWDIWNKTGMFVGGAIKGHDSQTYHVGICGGCAFIEKKNAVLAGMLLVPA